MSPGQNWIKSHPIFEDWAVIYKSQLCYRKCWLVYPFKNLLCRKHNKMKSQVTFIVQGQEVWFHPGSIMNTTFNGIYEGLGCVIKFLKNGITSNIM